MAQAIDAQQGGGAGNTTMPAPYPRMGQVQTTLNQRPPTTQQTNAGVPVSDSPMSPGFHPTTTPQQFNMATPSRGESL